MSSVVTEPNIFEEKKVERRSYSDYKTLMTEEQFERGRYYSHQYFMRMAEMKGEYEAIWNTIQKHYECKRGLPSEADESFPNSFIPLTTPCIEGQTASMAEQNMEFRHTTSHSGHEIYMNELDGASEFYRNKMHFKRTAKDFMRSYLLYGNAWIEVGWDDFYRAGKGVTGMPRLIHPSLTSVIVDGGIKDAKDLQYAQYIIRVYRHTSIGWARREYKDDDLVSAISASPPEYEGVDPDQSMDDFHTFTLLKVWTRDNEQGNLQLIEMDTEGLILRESDPSQPYYKYTNNEYPFMMARMIPQLGKFYGIGDGAILERMQETVNKLTDEFEIAARFSAQSRTFVDPLAEMDGDQMTSNPSDIIWAKDPHNAIYVVPGTGVSPVIQAMISFLLAEAQKATRFHESMTGTQMNVSATATQINTQQAQGYVGIKDKKSDISEVLAWADMHAIKICMEMWDGAFWASTSDTENVFIDMKTLTNINSFIPATMDDIQSALAANLEAPSVSIAVDEEGNEIMTELDFTTKVIIGEGMPKGSTDIYNILLGLAQMRVIGKDGQPEPLVTAERMRQLMEDVLGFKLKTRTEDETGEGDALDRDRLNQINPVGQEGTVQMPTAGVADNLQRTVPQMPDMDSRRINI